MDDDRVVVSNSKDNALYHWDFISGKQLHTVVRAHDSQIRDMDCLGSTVATASFDKTVKLWSPHLPPAERSGSC
jgi:WD40 repeat protein